MTSQRERDCITELIDLYKDFPCLWDLSSPCYTHKLKKKHAWEVLVNKYKGFDHDANDATVKKKIDNLKSSYYRESRKIKDSKSRTGSAASDVYKPSLWYFELMTFLDKKDEVKRNGTDSFVSEDEDDRHLTETSAKRRKQKDRNALELHQQKLLDTAENLLKQNNKEMNPFGIYVGETLERISPDQRDIAEKLISDVLFLARRNNLSCDSKIEANPSDGLLVSYKSEPFT